jgi:hypothetical protein
MKGFLFRVAASVVRPQPSVHPIVDSIYSNSRLRSATSLTQQETFSVTASPDTDNTLGSEQRETARTSLETHNKPASSPVERQAGEVSDEPFRPLLPRRTFEANAAETSSPNISHPRSRTEGDSPLSPSHPEHVVPSIVSGFVPIVRAPDSVSAESISAISKPQPPHAPREDRAITRAQSRRQSGQALPASRASQGPADDIQIHIGRIEVIAVPPPVQRPATAPPQKRLSLDEYLNRRNGRSR